jgi:hypothetical protein
LLNPSREAFHRKAHLFCLLLMATGLPLSMFLMSSSGILLAFNWLLWGNPVKRFRTFLGDRSAVVFTLLYLVHIGGVLYSADTAAAFSDLRIKLPLLFFPVVLSSVPQLGRKTWLLVLRVFVAAVLTATFICFAIYMNWTWRKATNFRELSPFISHIRLSLLVCISCMLLFFCLVRQTGTWLKLAAATGIFWQLYVLNLLQSATGFIVITVLLGLWLISRLGLVRNRVLRYSLPFVVGLLPMLFIGYHAQRYFLGKDHRDHRTAAMQSVNGEPYTNDWTNTLAENGHYVFYNIAPEEMNREWAKRSRIPLDSMDAAGFHISGRVYRYMASLNLPKDSLGLTKLTDQDIRAIERGETNVNYREKIPGIRRRLDNTFLEIDTYLNGNVNGNSVIQRWEYLKTGLAIAAQNPVAGVGTGDLQQAFDAEYEKRDSALGDMFRLRAHNQYLTMYIAFGLAGFLVFLTSVFYPPACKNTWRSIFFRGFMTVALISFLSEDTLETQAGVSFFIFFYAMMVWGVAAKNE